MGNYKKAFEQFNKIADENKSNEIREKEEEIKEIKLNNILLIEQEKTKQEQEKTKQIKEERELIEAKIKLLQLENNKQIEIKVE